MTNKMFFEETNPGVFERNKNFRIKSNLWVREQYNDIDDFCHKIRNVITNLFEKFSMKYLSNRRFVKFSTNKNKLLEKLNKIFLTMNFSGSKKL